MVTTISAGTLRLLLTSISYRAKARKRYGGSRQWFRAARRAPAAGLPRRAGMVCDVLHPYIPYYNRRSALACTASWRGGSIWYRCKPSGAGRRSSVAQAVRYSWMHPPHDSGKTRQIAGKAPVKPGALFCVVGGIIALTAEKLL